MKINPKANSNFKASLTRQTITSEKAKSNIENTKLNLKDSFKSKASNLNPEPSKDKLRFFDNNKEKVAASSVLALLGTGAISTASAGTLGGFIAGALLVGALAGIGFLAFIIDMGIAAADH